MAEKREKGRVSNLLSGLEKDNSKIDKANENNEYMDIILGMRNSFTYNLPILADAVLDIIKEEEGGYKNDILKDIVLNYASDEVLEKAKNKVLLKMKK